LAGVVRVLFVGTVLFLDKRTTEALLLLLFSILYFYLNWTEIFQVSLGARLAYGAWQYLELKAFF
jgi:hypothetical protein